MKRTLLAGCFVFLNSICFSQTKTWIGANGANWNVAGNWSPSGVPGTGDTVIFNSFNACNVDINPAIAALRVLGSGGILISTSALRTISINNNAAANPVLSVASGSSLTLGNGGFGVSIQTYGGLTPNYADIDGTMNFSYASSWTLCNATFTTNTNADISGTINVISVHTGALFTNSSSVYLRFLSGSSLNWQRNGGTIPAANFQNGSTINVTGTTSTMLTFNTSSVYNGLIVWNAASQTISGASAILLPSPFFSVDSVRVQNTGSGTLRMATNPSGYTVGHLEVQGGTVEMSAPASATGSGTISTDLKMTGGTIIGNATYAFDNLAAYPMSLIVNGNLIISGSSTFNWTNRPTANAPAGAFQLNVKGNVTQTAGTITTTSAFGSQNYLMFNGTVSQNVQITNMTGSVGLVMYNAAGAVLQAPLTVPYGFNFISGVLTSTATNLLTFSAGTFVAGASNNSFVDGPVRKTGNTAFTFPIGKQNCGPSGAVNGYASLAIGTFTGGAITDQFTAEYKRGDAMALGAISSPGLDHISRCDYWTLTRDNGSSTVDITLAWNESINNCITAYPYVNNLGTLTIAHNNNAGGAWDVIGTAGVTTGNATAGTVIWNGTQSATFGAFAIGSTNFQNPLPFTINYFRGVKFNREHQLDWYLSCYSTPSVTMSLERSADQRTYTMLHTIHASAQDCLQPFGFRDNNPVPGINHYRLKILDADGRVSYSTVITLINADRGLDVQPIAPNPVTGAGFSLRLSVAKAGRFEFVITDMQGRLIRRQAQQLIAGFSAIPVDVSRLPAGSYQLSGSINGERTRVLRFVKQ